MKAGRTQRLRHEARRLAEEVAPRTKPVPLLPPPNPEDGRVDERRRMFLAQLKHQVLLGLPAAEGPCPALGFSERESSLLRAKFVDDPAFVQLDRGIRASPARGAFHFGSAAAFGEVAWLFGMGERAASKKAFIAVDLSKWKADAWRAFLASDRGRDVVEAGRIKPAPESSTTEPR